jgi:hypothetical protein
LHHDLLLGLGQLMESLDLLLQEGVRLRLPAPTS